MRLEAAQADELLVEQGVRDRGEQQRVRPRSDEVVLVGLARRSRPHRVDDDHLAVARPDRAQPASHVGSGDEVLPFETTGLAPSTRRCEVRSTSGIPTVNCEP